MLCRGILGVAGVVGSSAAFYWLISTHELERLSDWLISLHKRACGIRVGLWHAEVGQEQGGSCLLKFLGEADESTKIKFNQSLVKALEPCKSFTKYFTKCFAV